MELDYLMLADAVTVAENKLYIHGGGLASIRVPQVPWPLQLGVAGRFVAQEAELGEQHHFSLVVIEPDGSPVFPIQPIPFTLGPQHYVAEGESELQVLVAIALGPIALRHTGWHTFSFGLDEEPVLERYLRVAIA